MESPEQQVLKEIAHLRDNVRRPIVVALDGGSGAGKSTIAQRLMRLTEVALVPLDDFYQTRTPESELQHKTVEERLNGVFDWDRVRCEALEPLRAGRPARWHAFDFISGLSESGTYNLKSQATDLTPAPTIVLDGAYSAAPPLRDLLDLAVLVDTRTEARYVRTVTRGDDAEFLRRWHEIWDEVAAYYFEQVCPRESFDLIIRNDEDGRLSTDGKQPGR